MLREIKPLRNDQLTPRSTSACLGGDLYVLGFGDHCVTNPARREGKANGP